MLAFVVICGICLIKILCDDAVKIVAEQKDDCGGEEHGDEADGIEKRIKSASEKSPFSKCFTFLMCANAILSAYFLPN